MAEVLSPPAPSPSLSPASNNNNSSTDSLPSLPPAQQHHPQPRPAQPRERVPSYAQNRMSQYSRSSQRSRSRPQSPATLEYGPTASSLPYALVRDFAYPAYHPLHYGAQPEPSGASTPGSEWNASMGLRRQSDPMEQWNTTTGGSATGWSVGPWGGDGAMYGDPEQTQQDGEIAALPSTSFGNEDGGAGSGDEEVGLRKGGKAHRKSKSYANMSDFERGRRRESGRKGNRESADGGHMFYFHGQQSDLAGRDSLRQSRGHSFTGAENGASNGGRRDSRFGSTTTPSSATTLPNRSFHHSQAANNANNANSEDFDPDDHIPLDTEPHASHSPIRDSMGPEDEELFAGPSLALYAFEPENSNELRLVEGQEIMVSYRHGQGWLVASDPRTGEQGLVPEAYVRLIADMPNYDPETGEFVDLEEEDEDSHVVEDVRPWQQGRPRCEERGEGGGDENEADEDGEHEDGVNRDGADDEDDDDDTKDESAMTPSATQTTEEKTREGKTEG